MINSHEKQENKEVVSIEVGKKSRDLHLPKKPKINHRFFVLVRNFFGLLLLCVAASSITAWIIIGSGWFGQNAAQTITENREKIVLQEGEIVSDVFEKVSPSTVSITTQAIVASSYYSSSSVQEGEGSGIIVSSDGYILTNKHVVPDGTSKVTVVLHDGREFSAQVVGRDPLNDIAFIKVNGVDDLTAATLGNSDEVKPGQKVIAIGNALGEFSNSVTAGIVSGIGRPVEATDDLGGLETLENLIQTDAAINLGNSGGPLLNLKGEVIGINTAIAEESQSIGFAIPINDAKGLMENMLKTGKVERPYLGVRYISLTSDIAKQLGTDQTQGAYLSAESDQQSAVVTDSPADKAGLKQGDVIKKVGDINIDQTNTLASLLARYSPGDSVKLTYIRDGQEKTVEVTLSTYQS
ncbi:MAG: trypsin-like peptidase domain-containing protein [Candidatus Woesebacteria bacterium]|jgi:serine protease Do